MYNYSLHSIQTTNTCSLWFEASADYTNDNFIRTLHLSSTIHERPIKNLNTTNGTHQTSVIMTLKCPCSSITHTRIRKYCIILCTYFSAEIYNRYLQIAIYVIILYYSEHFTYTSLFPTCAAVNIISNTLLTSSYSFRKKNMQNSCIMHCQEECQPTEQNKKNPFY